MDAFLYGENRLRHDCPFIPCGRLGVGDFGNGGSWLSPYPLGELGRHLGTRGREQHARRFGGEREERARRSWEIRELVDEYGRRSGGVVRLCLFAMFPDYH